MIALTMVVMGLVLMIGIGISFVHLRSIRAIEVTEESIKAFYAADSGLEKTMLQMYSDTDDSLKGEDGTLQNDAYFETSIIENGVYDCDAPFYCIDSFGVYGEVKRALRVTH